VSRMRTQGPGKDTIDMDNLSTNHPNNSYTQPSFSTTLLLKHGRTSTSPIRTMTNGSIMNNSNINRLYNTLPATNVPTTEVNGNVTTTIETQGGEKFEVPLPFGYHLDLDFLRVCSDELVSGETLRKLKELKKQRRKERKTLEALMGIKQENKEKQRIVREMPPAMSPILQKKSPPTTLQLSQPDIIHSSELVREALRESMLSFQETLDKYREEAGDISDFDLLSHGVTSTPSNNKVTKFSTYPRQVQNLASPNDDLPGGKLSRQLSNSSISSISTSSSALPYNTPLTPEAYLASLPSCVTAKPDEMDTNSIVSISSEMSTATLRNVREQMARSLVKLKEYEKQVEAIPVLQVKLSVLKEEKRLLMLKLKAREAKLRKDRGEMYESDGAFDSMAFEEEMDTDDEDLDSRVAKMSHSLTGKYAVNNQNQRRARSESPYAKCATVHPEDFISFQRKRSTSCGFNSDSSDVSPSGGRKYYTQDSPEYAGKKAKFMRSAGQAKTPPVETREQGVNTDSLPAVPVATPTPEPVKSPQRVFTREKGSNTDPAPKSPPPVRKQHKGNNTLQIRSIPKGSSTELRMTDLISKDELESKIQDAVFRTEEDIMSCPLLQKAMQKVEEEALNGPEPKKEFFSIACQVGQENLRPFTIDMGVLCKIEDEEEKSIADSWCQVSPVPVKTQDASCGLSSVDRANLTRTVGVGECRIIEDPKEPNKSRTVGVVTEKWVEVIRASKQTDTEDFAYKDTESPRVADIPMETITERPDRRQRLSSLTSPCLRNSMSPSVSRRSSTNSPSVSRKSSAANTARTERAERVVDQKSQGTMTELEMKAKMPTKDVTVETERLETKSASTSALILPLSKALPPGSPLSTPEIEQRPPLNLNLCDKCDKDIHQVAAGIISGPPVSQAVQTPSLSTPWVSKIPRPCPMENPEVSRLKGATSTGNLSLSPRSQSPVPLTDRLQRSKSNLEPSNILSRYSNLGYSSRTPPPQRRDMGTPPPHPKSPAPGSKRAPSPLSRSPGPSMTSSYSAPSGDKKSLIPKFSPSGQRKTPTSTPSKFSNPTSPLAESKSLIPRVVTPPALRKMFPKNPEKTTGGSTEKNTARKQTYSRGQAGITNPDLDKIEEHPRRETVMQQVKKKISDIKEKLSGGESDSGDETETLDDTDRPDKPSGSFPLPGSALFTPIEPNRKKMEPSKEMKAALKVLNDSLSRGASRSNAQVTNAVNIIQQEWFKTSSTKQSNPLDVEDYLDSIEEMSKELLDQVINLSDVNGNTALHYSVSHGNFDVVAILLDSKVANANILNKAGYTCSMLISLANISNESHRAVVKKLFSISDLNLRASQHGQTALMLAVSHGRLDMVQLLTEAGADLNIRDEDGSTALMCAAEHGHLEIVKVLMQHPDINIGATDNDGLSALSVAMEAGHRDIGVLLYANMSFSRGTSPHSSIRMKKSSSRSSIVTGSQSTTPVPAPVSSPVPPTPPHRSRRNSTN